MSETIGVFVPPDTDALFHFHFDKCWITHLIKVYTDIAEFKSSHHNQKITCLQMPYPLQASFHDIVRDLIKYSDHILVLMSELHNSTVEFAQTHDNKKISYFICGDFNFILNNSPVHKFYDWFSTTVHFYKFVRPMLLSNALTPYESKPRFFDALLGRKKLHRDVAYSRIDQNQNVVAYLDRNNIYQLTNHLVDTTAYDFTDAQRWVWEEDGLVLENPVAWTVDKVNYYGYRMSLSQVAPLKVYKQTAYSLIAETSFANHYSFYTEKTVKPLMCKRLFVLLAGQCSLKNLQAMGFKTFADIIDESYDIIEDPLQRWARAMDQVEYLQTQPQEYILEKIAPICDYNHSQLMRTNWYEQYFMPAFVAYFQREQN